MSDVHLTPVDEDLIDTILQGDVEFSGRMSFDKPLMIKGRVSGAIESTSDLYVDDAAVVEARISANIVSVRGTVKGDISARERVELFACAAVEGDIVAPEITMETGCRFNGICTMTGSKPKIQGAAPSRG
ncbi:MAG: polymer-forming cytoskeletal protein [Spirochaetales bacterium]|nr:polymer-forming cytoskeletal protein [Spirochaetales bacterium]